MKVEDPPVTTRATAEHCMAEAKQRFTAAARAALAGDPAAIDLAEAAIREVRAARAALEALARQGGQS